MRETLIQLFLPMRRSFLLIGMGMRRFWMKGVGPDRSGLHMLVPPFA